MPRMSPSTSDWNFTPSSTAEKSLVTEGTAGVEAGVNSVYVVWARAAAGRTSRTAASRAIAWTRGVLVTWWGRDIEGVIRTSPWGGHDETEGDAETAASCCLPLTPTMP